MIPGSRAAEEFSLNSWKPGVSAVVVCFNEEDNIGSCLESVKWCDEIIVVDSFSTDRTLEICSRYTNRITQRLWKGYRDQPSFAISLAKECHFPGKGKVDFSARCRQARLFGVKERD